VDFPIRPTSPDEFHALGAANAHGFGVEFRPELLDARRPIFEFDRSLAAFDGDQIVSTAGVFSLDMTIPGGRLPVAGVTWVSVRPTHRRKGILTAMMRRQLSDIRERGEAIAALWATEAPIYGRFGYGLASEGVEIRIDRTRTGLAHTTPARGRTRLVTRDEALESWPAVHDRLTEEQPGHYRRRPDWWRLRNLPEQESPNPGYTSSFLVQYEEDGQVDGYVRYAIKQEYVEGSAAGTLFVTELTAATDAAYSALWSYVFGVDLIGKIEALWRSVDEPLNWMLSDPRRLIRRTQDTLWVRVVDVEAALAARRYSAEGRIVFEVRDPFCPWVGGRYELEGGPDGATCRATTAPPDITLDADALGTAYLGNARFQLLKRAGRVEGDAAALRFADAMFGWSPLPWCDEIF
jgi:predicted acetyltransferase